LNGWRLPLGIAALGALQTLAFVHTSAWWLPLLCTAALAAAVARATPRRAALLGWLYGSAWLGAGTWWLFISLHRYGGLPAALAVAAVALLCLALALYLALAMGLYARWRRGRLWIDAPLFASLWLLADLARTVIFTGFPWLGAGYAQVDSPLAAWAPWLGVHGIGALVALLAALLARALPPRPPRRRALAAVALVALVLAGSHGLGAVEFSRHRLLN
jgi:apolipoprotein N-acyltransferase